jgi:hypothetical protein
MNHGRWRRFRVPGSARQAALLQPVGFAPGVLPATVPANRPKADITRRFRFPSITVTAFLKHRFFVCNFEYLLISHGASPLLNDARFMDKPHRHEKPIYSY